MTVDIAAAVDVDDYLDRIGFEGPVGTDAETLRRLQRRHLTEVPFENLSIVRGQHLPTDAAASIDKIVRRRRGGWCFELNGAFAGLLTAIGFPVRPIGAAVLLDGPSRVVEHLALEVTADDEVWLVDVGFGDTFVDPIRINAAAPQPGGNGIYELIASAEGTTLTRHRDGSPTPEYRFRRVALTLADLTPISDSMQVDPTKRWRSHPFATRLVDDGPGRVTLTADRLRVTHDDGTVDDRTVDPADWDTTLAEWFGESMLH